MEHPTAAMTRPSRTRTAVVATVAALLTFQALPTVDRATSASATAAPFAVSAEVEQAVAADGSAEVIVEVRDGFGAEAMAAVRDGGGELLLPLPIVDGFSARVTGEALDELAALGPHAIRAVSLDDAMTLHHTPSLGEGGGDSFFPESIGADVLRTRGVDGSGVGIAVVDTGVTAVPDLADRIVGGIDLTADGDGVDHYGHGTFIAGIAAGSGAASSGKFDGVAPGAHVVPVKIAGRAGATDVSHVLAAIQWVVSFKDTYDIGVLNLSVGTDSTQPAALSPLNYAVERAWDSGIVVVVSAGNHGPEKGRIPKPADDPLVITVGATDANGTKPRGDDIVPDFSSRGPSIADGFVKPDLVAPGSHIIAAKSPGSAADLEHPEAHIRDDYMRASGTSFSAAVVSGAVALLRDAHPEWTPDQIKGALTAMATPGPVGDRNVDGHGIVDVAAAAALTDPPLANQGVVRSSGLGTLDDDRGSLEVEITLDPLLGLTELLVGETTAQDQLFSALEYTTTEWTGASWYGASWYGASWYGASWYGASWYGASWYGASWYGASWY